MCFVVNIFLSFDWLILEVYHTLTLACFVMLHIDNCIKSKNDLFIHFLILLHDLVIFGLYIKIRS
jgi:hypothetical protein